MSRDHNPLAKWLTKAKDIPAPPSFEEQRGREAGRKKTIFRQLNLKVSDRTYTRFKQLAHRDRFSGVAFMDELLDLYEKERGALDA